MKISEIVIKDVCKFIVRDCRRKILENPDDNHIAICRQHIEQFRGLSLLLVDRREKKYVIDAVDEIRDIKHNLESKNVKATENV